MWRNVLCIATIVTESAPRGRGDLRPYGAAAPFAYVSNGSNPGTVSVIDTATNTVVATVAVGSNPIGVAVTPDGKHV